MATVVQREREMEGGRERKRDPHFCRSSGVMDIFCSFHSMKSLCRAAA